MTHRSHTHTHSHTYLSRHDLSFPLSRHDRSLNLPSPHPVSLYLSRKTSLSRNVCFSRSTSVSFSNCHSRKTSLSGNVLSTRPLVPTTTALFSAVFSYVQKNVYGRQEVVKEMWAPKESCVSKREECSEKEERKSWISAVRKESAHRDCEGDDSETRSSLSSSLHSCFLPRAVFVMPSTSSMTKKPFGDSDKLQFFRELKSILEEVDKDCTEL